MSEVDIKLIRNAKSLIIYMLQKINETKDSINKQLRKTKIKYHDDKLS